MSGVRGRSVLTCYCLQPDEHVCDGLRSGAVDDVAVGHHSSVRPKTDVKRRSIQN